MKFTVAGRRISAWWLSTAIALLLLSCNRRPPQETASQPAPPPSEAPSEPISAPSSSATAEEESSAPPSAPLTEDELWARLRQPQNALYVVLLRHAIAPGTGDPANFQLDDCATQRNLSEAGQLQASAIGQAFRGNQVPVRQVLSSQWCRCLETARLMDLGEVTPFPPLNSFFRDRSTADSQTAAVRSYLQDSADTPGVLVLVTHQVNITGLTGIVPRSGEAVVLEATEAGLTELGQFMPE